MAERHPFHTLLPDQVRLLHLRALKLTGNPHRADDLVQDTLLRAWAKRDSYTPDTMLRAWLFTILRNAFFSELRKHRREVEDIDGALVNALFEEPRQEHALALSELLTAIACLPDGQRRSITLMGAFGYSQEEAAAICGCSLGTIKSRVSRGRGTLGALLALDARPSPAAKSRLQTGRRSERQAAFAH